METRKLASIFVSFLNAVIATCEEAVEMTEKELAKGGDDNAESSKNRRENNKSGRSSKDKDDDDEKEEKGSRRSSRSKDKDDDDDDDDDKKEKGGDDEPSLEDLQSAVRAALKVCEKVDVIKTLKKHGKAEKASDVEAENRQAAIDALDKMVDEA